MADAQGVRTGRRAAVGSSTTYVFTGGSAGDPPAPLGDSPSGMRATSPMARDGSSHFQPLAVPSGESPDGTGQWPVLPPLNTSSTTSALGFHGRQALESVVYPTPPTPALRVTLFARR